MDVGEEDVREIKDVPRLRAWGTAQLERGMEQDQIRGESWVLFWVVVNWSSGLGHLGVRDNTPGPGLEDHQHLQVTQRRRAAEETESEQLGRKQGNPQGGQEELTMVDAARRSHRKPKPPCSGPKGKLKRRGGSKSATSIKKS